MVFAYQNVSTDKFQSYSFAPVQTEKNETQVEFLLLQTWCCLLRVVRSFFFRFFFLLTIIYPAVVFCFAYYKAPTAQDSPRLMKET
jgi:hypothetical protein